MVSIAAPAQASSAKQPAGAGEPLLVSKISVPSMPGWLVPRPRLEKLIAHGAQGPITSVTGPPGAGKTAALALWAAGDLPSGPVAWVTMDDYDNRPRVFWSYVLAALRRAGVPVPRTMSATRRYAVDHEFLLRFASLMAAQDPPVTLVLDDLHLLTGTKVLEALAYVLRHGSPGLRLLVASRMDPLLPLHRYRLTGELTEVRASDLAFTIAEAGSLIKLHGVTLSAASLESLTQRAEGWAAVIRLAALSMAGHPDPDQFVKELAAEDSAVAGYLVEEVLNAQPARVRDFLLRTSVLDRFSEDIVSELGGDAAALSELAGANALIQRDADGWYRYHALFAAVLRLKMRRENPGLLPDLQRRAARWLRRKGLLADAIQHAADAGDWQFAARSVIDEFAVGELLEPRGDELLAGRLQPMPLDVAWPEPPPLLVAAAMEFADGQDAASDADASAAESMLGRLPASAELPSRLAASLIRLALSRRAGDFGAAAAAADRAQALDAAIPDDWHARHPWIRAQVLAGRGAVELWSGRFDEAATTFASGVAAARDPRCEAERAECLGKLALAEAFRGRLRRATELAAAAVARPDDDTHRLATPQCRAAEVALAAVHLEHNELADARRWQKRAHDSLQAWPDKVLEAAACLVAARRRLAEGHGKAASEILARARHGWSPPPWLDHKLTVLDSWAHVAAGDLRQAADLARQADPESSLEAAVALARALLASGSTRAAGQALGSAPSADDVPGTVRLTAWLADAQLGYATGDRVRGRRSLAHALRLAEKEELRLPFVMEHNWLAPVLRRDPELARPYRRLLEPGLVSPGPAGTGPAEPLIVEPLSEREREVLEHLSAMESTAEIASEMFISVNTVKTHLKSIYRKLSATHRGEAVRRARQRGLL